MNLKTRGELLEAWRSERCVLGSQYSAKLSDIRRDILDYFGVGLAERPGAIFAINLTFIRQWLDEQGYKRFMRHNFVCYQGIAPKRLTR